MDVLKSRDWSSLHILLLCTHFQHEDNCRINDYNAKHLINLELPNLRALGVDDFEEQKFTDVGLKKLLGKPWPKLLSLSLCNYHIINSQQRNWRLRHENTTHHWSNSYSQSYLCWYHSIYVGNSNITAIGFQVIENSLLKNLV